MFSKHSHLFSNEKLISDVQQIVNDAETTNISDDEATKVATYLFMCLTYKNMQRPGPAINLTIEEANDHREGEDKINYVLSRTHKTARSLGPARLAMMEPLTFEIFQKYIKIVRSQIATSSNVNNALVTGKGKDYTQYLYHVRVLAKEYGVDHLPNPTSCRKQGATMAVSLLSKDQMENVSHHMGHSSSTSEKYYRSRQKKQEVTSAFNVMSTFMSKCLCILLLLYTTLPCRKSDVNPTPGNKPFQENETALISKYFKENITLKTTPSLNECRQCI